MGFIWCACGGNFLFSLWKKGILGYFPIGPKKKKNVWQLKCKQAFFVVLMLQAKTDVCSWNNWELVEHCSLRKYLNYSNDITTSVMFNRSFESMETEKKKHA